MSSVEQELILFCWLAHEFIVEMLRDSCLDDFGDIIKATKYLFIFFIGIFSSCMPNSIYSAIDLSKLMVRHSVIPYYFASIKVILLNFLRLLRRLYNKSAGGVLVGTLSE